MPQSTLTTAELPPSPGETTGKLDVSIMPFQNWGDQHRRSAGITPFALEGEGNVLRIFDPTFEKRFMDNILRTTSQDGTLTPLIVAEQPAFNRQLCNERLGEYSGVSGICFSNLFSMDLHSALVPPGNNGLPETHSMDIHATRRMALSRSISRRHSRFGNNALRVRKSGTTGECASLCFFSALPG